MGICSINKQKHVNEPKIVQQNQKNPVSTQNIPSSIKVQSLVSGNLKIPQSKYSLAFSIPFIVGDFMLLDVSDGLVFNNLVKMGVQKQKKQQTSDFSSIFLYKQKNPEELEIYSQFGFILIDCNTILQNSILTDAKTSRVLFNFKYVWIFKDEVEVSKKHLTDLLKCFETQKIIINQAFYYSKPLNVMLQKLNLSLLQFEQSYFPLQMFCSADILEQTKLREESFNIYVHGSTHVASIIHNQSLNLYLKHLSIKTILFVYDNVDQQILQPLQNYYRVEIMNLKNPNPQPGQRQINEQLFQKAFLPFMEKIRAGNSNLLLVHDSQQPQMNQIFRETLELYMQIGLMIHFDDIIKYLDERKSGVSRQQVVQVKSQIKQKQTIVNDDVEQQQEIKSRCNEMKELYQNLLKREQSDTLIDGCHNTILKLISNIINNPENIKFKQIFKSNKMLQMNILQYPEGLELIKLCGFIQSSENEQIFINQFDIGMIKLARGDLELAYTKYKQA